MKERILFQLFVFFQCFFAHSPLHTLYTKEVSSLALPNTSRVTQGMSFTAWLGYCMVVTCLRAGASADGYFAYCCSPLLPRT